MLRIDKHDLAEFRLMLASARFGAKLALSVVVCSLILCVCVTPLVGQAVEMAGAALTAIWGE